jgi:hypothetical protein
MKTAARMNVIIHHAFTRDFRFAIDALLDSDVALLLRTKPAIEAHSNRNRMPPKSQITLYG